MFPAVLRKWKRTFCYWKNAC